MPDVPCGPLVVLPDGTNKAQNIKKILMYYGCGSGAGDGSCLCHKGAPGQSQGRLLGISSASQGGGLEVAVCGEGCGKTLLATTGC